MEQNKKQIKRQTENINKVLYDTRFGVWIKNETLDNLIELFDLDWNLLMVYATNKEKLNKINIINRRIKAIEKEIVRRGAK